MRFLGPREVRASLPISAAIEAMRNAFSDDIENPLRIALGSSLFMPGRVGETTGIKVVSTVPGNPVGIVVAFGADGSPLGAVDGPTLTAIRTGAGCGLATDLLARDDATVMAMLGAGAMAADQISAVLAVRPLSRILVWSRSFDHAKRLAERFEPGEAIADASDAVAAADIVTTATPATAPLFDASAVRPGTHINAVGAFTPEMCEIPPDVVSAAYVVVDDRTAAAAEAGDLLRAGREPDATMADLLAGREMPFEAPFTLFKSVGIASQDVAAAVAALRDG